MTRSSKRRSFSDAEKAAAVQALRSRGTRPVREICDELGIGVPLLYYWARKHPSTTLARASAVVAVAEPPRARALTDRDPLLDELARLRDHVRRLERALIAALDLVPQGRLFGGEGE